MSVGSGIKRIVLVLSIIIGICGYFFGEFYWNVTGWTPKYYVIASEIDPPPPGFELKYKIPPQGFKLITPHNPRKRLLIRKYESEGGKYYLERIPGQEIVMDRVRFEIVRPPQKELMLAGFIAAGAAFLLTWIIYYVIAWIVDGFRKKEKS